MRYAKDTKEYIVPVIKASDSMSAVILPIEVTSLLGEKAIACAGADYTIRLFTEKQWGGFIDKLRGRPFEEIKLFRLFFSFSTEVFFEHTPQGERIYLPAKLLDYAKIACDEQTEAKLFFNEDTWYITALEQFL